MSRHSDAKSATPLMVHLFSYRYVLEERTSGEALLPFLTPPTEAPGGGRTLWLRKEHSFEETLQRIPKQLWLQCFT